MNLLALRTSVLGFINRPASELGDQVDEAINTVLLRMQRLHKFKFSERLVEVVYPANTLQLELTGACEGTPRDIISIQQLSGTTKFGSRLKVLTYLDVINRRGTYANHYQADTTESVVTHSTFVNEIRGYDAFLVNNAIGLYPTPTVDVNLLVNLHIWLPELVEDTDENFFSELAHDLVVDMTLERMNIFLKEDDRTEISAKQIAEGWEALKQWDAHVGVSVE